MSAVLPPAFFFRFAIPVLHRPDVPQTRGDLLGLSEEHRLPRVMLAETGTPFGDVRLAWNAEGLAVSAEVRGKKMPVSQMKQATAGDGLQIWIDTRNTQTIHRASRYCHHFCFLPGEAKKSSKPQAMELPINRARELRELANSEAFEVRSQHFEDGYRLEAWLPAKVMVGYDPDANPQLGFYYLLQDAELGRQFLSIGDEFPFAEDPSVWSTLELVSE